MDTNKRRSPSPPSPPSSSSTTESDIQQAHVAMTRAAEAMIAATESFRRQFHERLASTGKGSEISQTSKPKKPKKPKQQYRMTKPSSARRLALEDPFTDPQVRPDQASITSSSGQSSLSKDLPKPPEEEGTAIHHLTSTEWLSKYSPSVTQLEPVRSTEHLIEQDRYSPLRHITGRFSPSPSSRTTGPVSVQKGKEVQVNIARVDKDDELEPQMVMNIGRYTYVRSAEMDVDDVSSVRRDRPVRFRQAHERSTVQEILFVLIVCLAPLLTFAGISQASVPSWIIHVSLQWNSNSENQNGPYIGWYSAAYLLAIGALALPAGRLGDLVGHRPVFAAGFAWLAIGSLMAGFAKSVKEKGSYGSNSGTAFFISCRAIQGIGPAMLLPNGQALLRCVYYGADEANSRLRKGLVLGLYNAAAPIGFVAGAVMASLFLSRASWPWAFWSMAAISISLAALSLVVLPSDRRKTKTVQFTGSDEQEKPETDDTSSIWSRLDLFGMFLLVIGLGSLNFFFNQSLVFGTSIAYFLAPLLVGVLLPLAFFFYSLLRVSSHPLMPVSTMHPQTYIVLLCIGGGWSCFSIWLYYAVLVLIKINKFSRLRTSASFTPAAVTGIAASVLTGLLFRRRLRPQWILFGGMFAFLSGSVLFATMPEKQSYWLNMFFSIAVMPFGMAMTIPAATAMLDHYIGPRDQGAGAGLMVTAVYYSMSTGLGMARAMESGAIASAMQNGVACQVAQYFGVGLGGLGLVLAIVFVVHSYVRREGR